MYTTMQRLGLLTAITGPDYIDQGTIGVVDDQDMGTWVKFSYGKFSKQYKWRQPYVGQETSPGALGASTFQEGAYSTPLFLVADNEQVACRSIVPVKLAVELRHPGYRSAGRQSCWKKITAMSAKTILFVAVFLDLDSLYFFV